MSKYITSTSNVLGGQAVIVNTRVPISRILFLLKDGYTLDAIHEEYPHIDLQTLSGAIDEVSAIVNSRLHDASLS